MPPLPDRDCEPAISAFTTLRFDRIERRHAVLKPDSFPKLHDIGPRRPTDQESTMAEPLPLEGLRVVDLADEKGELCGRMLADFGAEVTPACITSAITAVRSRRPTVTQRAPFNSGKDSNTTRRPSGSVRLVISSGGLW